MQPASNPKSFMRFAEISAHKGDSVPLEKKPAGISRNTFILGLLIAIIASVLISTILVAQLVAVQGLKGDKGDTGSPGSAGIFGSKAANDTISTTETMQFVDVEEMSLTLTLNETSHILILFSCEAWPDFDETIIVRALVGETTASPGEVNLVPTILDYNETEAYSVRWGSYTYNFHQIPVDPGTYIIKIQWRISGKVGDMRFRNLTAIALPIAAVEPS